MSVHSFESGGSLDPVRIAQDALHPDNGCDMELAEQVVLADAYLQLRRIVLALAKIAPVGDANVHEEHRRQEAHKRAIRALGLEDPGEYVPSDYWSRYSP